MGTCQLNLDISALHHNLKRIQTIAPQTKKIAMLKANAYGHGLLTIATALEGHTDALAVFSLTEALMLRQAGITQRILLLHFITKEALEAAIQAKLDLVISQSLQLSLIQSISPLPSSTIHCWLKINTGMHRLGFHPDTVPQVYRKLMACPWLTKPLSFLTHFANADNLSDPTTPEQITHFNQITQAYPSSPKALANSAGLLAWPQSHADWVRCGLALYGASPLPNRTGLDEGLQPVMTLSSQLIHVQQLTQGSSIGYGNTWVCPEDMHVGIVSIGYSNGYPYHAPAGTPININGIECPLIGRVAMNMLHVDLRPCPQAAIGDTVILWGKGLPVERIAKAANTLPHALLCGVIIPHNGP